MTFWLNMLRSIFQIDRIRKHHTGKTHSNMNFKNTIDDILAKYLSAL